MADDLHETIRMLMDACNELMTEFIGKKRAADWEVINDAMLAGANALLPPKPPPSPRA